MLAEDEEDEYEEMNRETFGASTFAELEGNFTAASFSGLETKQGRGGNIKMMSLDEVEGRGDGSVGGGSSKDIGEGGIFSLQDLESSLMKCKFIPLFPLL